MKTLFVVANRSRALALFVTSMRQKQADVDWELTNPDGRKLDRELASDEPGQVMQSRGTFRHVIEPPTTPSESVAKAFALKIVQKLEADLERDPFSRLALM